MDDFLIYIGCQAMRRKPMGLSRGLSGTACRCLWAFSQFKHADAVKGVITYKKSLNTVVYYTTLIILLNSNSLGYRNVHQSQFQNVDYDSGKSSSAAFFPARLLGVLN
jgi:hypothetical protein